MQIAATARDGPFANAVLRFAAYNRSMIASFVYALVSVAFAVMVAMWLRVELKRPDIRLGGRWLWLATAAVLQAAAGILAAVYDDSALGNVLLHAIGGGAVAATLFYYLLRTFGVRLNWRLQLAVLFCFTCTLGVLNELAEFALELAGVGTFSFGPQDTWRDFVSNTSGSLAVWLLVRLANSTRNSTSPTRD